MDKEIEAGNANGMDEANEYVKDEATGDEALRKLERTLADLQRTSNKALGFVDAIEYRGVRFNVSKRFVFADLAPLVFFHLIEQITDDVSSTIVRLYHRLGPLLLCRHDWVPLKRADDDQVRFIVAGAGVGPNGRTGRPNVTTSAADSHLPSQASGPFICRFCTAYSLGPPLPAIGRDPG